MSESQTLRPKTSSHLWPSGSNSFAYEVFSFDWAGVETRFIDLNRGDLIRTSPRAAGAGTKDN